MGTNNFCVRNASIVYAIDTSYEIEDEDGNGTWEFCDDFWEEDIQNIFDNIFIEVEKLEKKYKNTSVYKMDKYNWERNFWGTYKIWIDFETRGGDSVEIRLWYNCGYYYGANLDYDFFVNWNREDEKYFYEYLNKIETKKVNNIRKAIEKEYTKNSDCYRKVWQFSNWEAVYKKIK